jgi:hypothetical protein
MLHIPAKNKEEVKSMAEESKIQTRQMQALTIKLTADQRDAIERFWRETGGLGSVGIQVEVVNDKISPASIQVGTAK